MAGCKSSISGNDFYGAYDAQEIATKHAPELGMQVWRRGVRSAVWRFRGSGRLGEHCMVRAQV